MSAIWLAPKRLICAASPNGREEIAHRSPQEIMDEIAALDAESAEVLGNIKHALSLSNGALL